MTTPPKNSSNTQMVLPLEFNRKASFENFYADKNTELIAAMRSMVESYNDKILYFYGVSGSGKSHLMSAILRLAKENKRPTHYFSLTDQHVTPQLLEMTNGDSIVCIDDIQVWAGNESKERTLFALFERVKNANGCLFVSSTQPSQQSSFDLPDLISRLGSGLVYPLHGLDDSQYLNAFKLRTQQRGMSISEETVKYLLKHSARDTRQLFSLLDKIDKTSLIEKRRITIPFLQSILS